MAKSQSTRTSATTRKKSSTQDSVLASRTRLRRASGQLTAVIRMIDEGKSCDQIITQLAAVNKAINAAAFTIIGGAVYTGGAYAIVLPMTTSMVMMAACAVVIARRPEASV